MVELDVLNFTPNMVANEAIKIKKKKKRLMNLDRFKIEQPSSFKPYYPA